MLSRAVQGRGGEKTLVLFTMGQYLHLHITGSWHWVTIRCSSRLQQKLTVHTSCSHTDYADESRHKPLFLLSLNDKWRDHGRRQPRRREDCRGTKGRIIAGSCRTVTTAHTRGATHRWATAESLQAALGRRRERPPLRSGPCRFLGKSESFR